MVQSVELLLDPSTESAIRDQWAQLRAAGLPSEWRATRGAHRPHITVGVAGATTPDVEESLHGVATRLPIWLEVGSSLVFLHRFEILVRAVSPTDELRALQAEVHHLLVTCPGVPDTMLPDRWTPHVTLAHRLLPEQTVAATGLLDWTPISATVIGIRRWDGDARQDWLLADPCGE